MMRARGECYRLYAQWRFLGLDPFRAFGGLGEPAFPERVEAMLTAFALHAANAESAVQDAIEALGSGLGGVLAGA